MVSQNPAPKAGPSSNITAAKDRAPTMKPKTRHSTSSLNDVEARRSGSSTPKYGPPQRAKTPPNDNGDDTVER